MKFLLNVTGELTVLFEKHEQQQQIDFLEQCICTDDQSLKVVDGLIDLIKNNPHPWLKLVQQETIMEIKCIYCGKPILGACYIVYHNPKKIEYRHVYCYDVQPTSPVDYVIADEYGDMNGTD